MFFFFDIEFVSDRKYNWTQMEENLEVITMSTPLNSTWKQNKNLDTRKLGNFLASLGSTSRAQVHPTKGIDPSDWLLRSIPPARIERCLSLILRQGRLRHLREIHPRRKVVSFQR